MATTSNADIKTFYKGFSIFTNFRVSENSINYTRQFHRIEETVKDAKKFILKNSLSLDVKFNKVLGTIEVFVIPSDNDPWTGIIEKLDILKQQLNG